MKQRLPATTADERVAVRLRELEQRVAVLEQRSVVRQVTGWGPNTTGASNAPDAPFGAMALDTDTSFLWLSVGSQWYWVAYVGP